MNSKNSISIDRVTYQVAESEFKSYTHSEYNNLKLYHQLADIERVVGLLIDMQDTFGCEVKLCPLTKVSFGGYIQDQLNISETKTNDEIQMYCSLTYESIQEQNYDFILSAKPHLNYSFRWTLLDSELYLSVSNFILERFKKQYHWYIQDDRFTFDNLIHLVMIVKNAGEGFREVLEKNIPHIDRWTILDTGSTDNTISIIQQVLATKVRGNLYQEPFVDFGTTRNRALELAGKACKFALMLDDTYYIVGDLRGFLNEIRSDQFADSYSLYITSDDVQYVSNRLLKTKRNLKYMFKIHEVVQEADNINVIVPIERASIHDKQSEYMQTRTRERKTLDLKLLFESIREEPDNPRHYYYIAQTYVGMENWEMAYKFFLQRVYHHVDGFLQEKIDACFEAARTAQFRLNLPWNEVKLLYEKAYKMDPSRPDSIYFLAIYDYLNGDRYSAYKKFKQAFEIGYPLHAQYSLKPTLSHHFVPKFLTELCYDYKDYPTGEAASRLYLEKNTIDPIIASWNSIYQHLNRLPKVGRVQRPTLPYLCFVADGNWNKWTGRDITTKGLGGSETYIVEMAQWIQASGKFQVFVFCRCSNEEKYKDVNYLDLDKYYSFIQKNIVHTSIISRYSEYLPVSYESNVENVFLVLHDLVHHGMIVPLTPKLKQIFTLSNWHKQHVDSTMSVANHLTFPIHYGVNSKFIHTDPYFYPKGFRFIYSSFANRGLRILLEMWTDIRRITNHQAILDVYSDIDHQWVNQHYPDEMKKIRILLESLVNQGVQLHGWVNKPQLAQAWLDADVWLYPCIFQETFCLTALEAAASRTLVITNDLAALQDTVGDRGIVVSGNADTVEWKKQVLIEIQKLYDSDDSKSLIDRNYEWALSHSWKKQANILLDQISKYPYEYRNMYNWTNDIPTGSKHVFEMAIQDVLGAIGQPLILEIGAYSGTSSVEFFKLLPNSTLTVIDPWENYDEFPAKDLDIMGSFLHNIQVSGYSDRIIIYKSDSTKQLLQLVQDQRFYHLIYVDGSHKLLDVYSDLILSWKLLVQKGMMIIDDYTWSPKPSGDLTTDLLSKPKLAVDHFLHTYKSEMRIIYKGYRIFIQKIKL